MIYQLASREWSGFGSLGGNLESGLPVTDVCLGEDKTEDTGDALGICMLAMAMASPPAAESRRTVDVDVHGRERCPERWSGRSSDCG